MKKFTFISLLLSFCFLAQGASRDEIIAAIIRSGSAMSSLECGIMQTRHSPMFEGGQTSQGKLCYSEPGKLRWETTGYIFVLNGDRAMICRDGKSSVLDAGSNKMIREMSSVMLGSISGRTLTDSRTFSISASEENGLWKVVLTPSRKELKQMWETLIMVFDPTEDCVRSIEINETSGDSTTIELMNVRKNAAVDESMFTINAPTK